MMSRMVCVDAKAVGVAYTLAILGLSLPGKLGAQTAEVFPLRSTVVVIGQPDSTSTALTRLVTNALATDWNARELGRWAVANIDGTSAELLKTIQADSVFNRLKLGRR